MSGFFTWPGPSGRESFRIPFGRLLIAAAACGLVFSASHAAEPKLPKLPADKNWKIEIVPGPAIGSPTNPKFEQAMKQALATQGETAPAAGVVTAGAESALPAGLTATSYAEVYNSIPFRRSEYAANPNYRHEATIELLLGQIRPKNITNISVPSATCCSPQTAMFDKWFAPWGTNAFDYRNSRYRP